MKKTACPLSESALALRGKTRQKVRFPIKSQLLYQLSYRGSAETFYGRATVDGKIYRESLKATVYSVAKQKLLGYVKE